MLRRSVLASLGAAAACPATASPAHTLLLGGYPAYSPVAELGADLLAYWEAERRDLITVATGVSSWRSVVGGYDAVQATGAAQPVWSAGSFGGRAGVSFDGTDDQLTFTLGGQLPAAANPSELWVLFGQSALVADATNRAVFGYGNTSTVARWVGRTVLTGVNRARGNTGDGAVAQVHNGTRENASSRHVVRWAVRATASLLTVDGVAEGSLSVVPSTTATRVRLGANAAATAAQFWHGQIAAAMVTLPLSEAKAAGLQRWLMLRK